MITIYVKDFNGEIDQKSYDKIINNLDLNTLQCPGCRHFGVKIHGYYEKPVKTTNGLIKLVIMRVICPICHKTHAILLSCLIPYQSIQLKDQLRIINNDDVERLMIANPFIDESDISRVKYNFKHFFKERFLSLRLKLDDDLIINCFKYFKRQFLQIKCLSNILYT